MDHIIIEEYQDKDFESVISLLVHSFNSKFCHRQNLIVSEIKDIIYASWDLKAGDPSYLHFVAKQNQNIVGVILILCGKKEKGNKRIPVISLCKRYGVINTVLLFFKMLLLDANTPNECYIEHIAVSEALRGKGIGRLLLQHAEQALLDRGYTSWSLAVAEDNSAKNLYSRLGFKEIKKIKSPLKGFFVGTCQWTFMRKNFYPELEKKH
ncbi:GNAT family N-acetyltransferase [Lacrimispora sp.]|uniref:GNAT family N-acetyltransferase n=1 Tax=Lacrimispora sp. TaxID=2719234 RepID=UPI0028633090|nr:GNAT family N-acetyltransferase [Lacrimispora sp.]MDR7811227.1 GNAT family N-acetyltransferase [Lacrimispora sp.]